MKEGSGREKSTQDSRTYFKFICGEQYTTIAAQRRLAHDTEQKKQLIVATTREETTRQNIR